MFLTALEVFKNATIWESRCSSPVTNPLPECQPPNCANGKLFVCGTNGVKNFSDWIKNDRKMTACRMSSHSRSAKKQPREVGEEMDVDAKRHCQKCNEVDMQPGNARFALGCCKSCKVCHLCFMEMVTEMHFAIWSSLAHAAMTVLNHSALCAAKQCKKVKPSLTKQRH